MFATSFVQTLTFAIAAMICVTGALGVVALRNPVHNALSLVATLFGVAVLFIAQEAYFLAAIQVIVYAGAIVVLFLFVIMLLGVDRAESFAAERHPLGLAVGGILGGGVMVLAAVTLFAGVDTATGRRSTVGALAPSDDLNRIGRALFTEYAFAFELTSLLLTIAVLGAVLLSRRASGPPIDLDEFPAEEPDADAEEVEA
jgi:NADH-quinone oxidoreductase subunit J